MATRYTPRIVTDGLVLCLDAGNTKSYPGSGTAWYDLSRNNNHATITSVSATNTYGPYGFYFPGNDVGSIQTNNTLSFGNSWTYEIVMYNNGDTRFIPFQTVGRETINTDFGYEVSAERKYQIFLGSDFGQWQYFTTALPCDSYTFIFLQVTMNNGTGNVYFSTPQSGFTRPIINGSYNSGQSSNEYLFWGKYHGGNGYSLNGAIYTTNIYNRALSPSEILQNYNATKSRFNL